jgi:hypothetical protein
MLCGADLVSVVLGPSAGRPPLDRRLGRADRVRRCLADRFDRIITGLARQLGRLDRDPTRGRYSVSSASSSEA